MKGAGLSTVSMMEGGGGDEEGETVHGVDDGRGGEE